MHGPHGLLWRRPGPCLVPMAPIGLLWRKPGPCLGQPCMVPMASCGGGLAPAWCPWPHWLPLVEAWPLPGPFGLLWRRHSSC